MVIKSTGALRAAIANSGWLVLDRVLRIAISLVVGAWVARHLGPAQFGQLAYVLALIALFQSICSLGVDGPIVRDISRDKEGSGLVLGTGLRLKVVAGITGWLLATLTVVAMRPGDWSTALMVFVAGAALVLQPADMIDLWLQSQNLSRLSVPYRLVAYAAVALTKVALILLDAPLWAFASAAALDSFFIAIGLTLSYRRHPSPSRWRWGPALSVKLLKESWPLMLAAASIGVYMRIDQVMLRELAGEHELGLYSAAIPFSQGWHLIPLTIYASVLPRLSQLRLTDPSHYDRRLQQVITCMTWGGVLASIVTIALAPLLVTSLLGERFSGAIPVLRWHVVTNVFVYMGVAQGLAIVSENTPKLSLCKALTGVVASLCFNYLLIPDFGAVGSAWAAIVSYGLSAVLSNVVLAPKSFRMQMRAFLPKL